MVSEYIQRKRLAKLGYRSDLSAIDPLKAEIFTIIDSEIDDLQEKEAKKRRGR